MVGRLALDEEIEVRFLGLERQGSFVEGDGGL